MSREKESEIVPAQILSVRDRLVVLDSHLAAIYGVATKNFNKAVRRNKDRFPPDFAFQLTAREFANLRFQIGTSRSHGGRRYRPFVFTEHGAIMAATILNSKRAVAMSVYVVRAFIKMRREGMANATLDARLQKIEKTLLTYDADLRELYQKLRPLLLPPPDEPKPRIGFHSDQK